MTASNVIELPWRARLRTSEKGKTIGDEANALIAMRHAPPIAQMLLFNEFKNGVEFRRDPPWRNAKAGDSWTDQDDVLLMEWLQLNGINMRSRSSVSECVGVIAAEHRIHPVREYLAGLEWDAVPRLSYWLRKYLGAKGDEEYLAAIGRRWLISAVARVMRPGCQADHTLVLEGLQGAGKSRTARALAVKPEWFADRIPDMHGADAAIQIAGRWVVEVAELAAIRHTASIEGVKAYLTRTHDVYRPPYGRRAQEVPRQCVFIGSTNEDAYLRDRTGNRRFWPVRCGDIEIELFERDRDQLWAEAYQAYRNGEPWHLDRDETSLAEAEQEQRVMSTELEHEVATYLERQLASGIHETDIRSILIGALNLEPDKSDYVEKAGRLGPQVIGVLRSQGWEKVGVVGRGKSRRNVFKKTTS